MILDFSKSKCLKKTCLTYPSMYSHIFIYTHIYIYTYLYLYIDTCISIACLGLRAGSHGVFLDLVVA